MAEQYIEEAISLVNPYFLQVRDTALEYGSSVLAAPHAVRAIAVFTQYWDELGSKLPVCDDWTPRACCIAGI
jgi:hypothetical protein